MTTVAGRRYAGRAAEERRAERRRRLLDAAVELFGERGYAATTIEALYSEARLAPRHFYEQFSSREELLEAVYEETIEAVLVAVTEARKLEIAGVRERVRAILDAFAGAMLSDARRARIAYLEVPGTSRRLEERARAVVRGFAAMVEEDARLGAAAGVLPDRDYELTARLLVGGTTSILLDWLAEPARRPLEQVLEELTSAFVVLLEQPPR